MVARKAKQAEEKVETAAAVETKPEPKANGKKEAKVHILTPGAERTHCGIWHQDPRAQASVTTNEGATCTVCLKVWEARLSPKAKKSKAKAAKTEVTCGVCGKVLEIFESLVDRFERCPDCSKKARRKRRAEKVRAKQKSKRSEAALELDANIEAAKLELDTYLSNLSFGDSKLKVLYAIRQALEAEIKIERALAERSAE